MIKAIISDIDGTLLNKDLQYTPRLAAAVKAVAERGVIFTLATGRMYVAAKHAVRGLDIKAPIICYNGGYVREFSGNDILYQQCIELNAAEKVLEACKRSGWHVQYYINDELYCPKSSETLIKYSAMTGTEHHILGDAFYQASDKINKILIIESNTDINQIRKELQVTGAKVDFTSSKRTFLEIVPQGVSKAEAIRRLATYLSISTDEIMAVGDSYNDMEMVRAVGHGVAMGNAEQELKAIAKYITDDNNNDGLAKAIEKYVLGE